MRTDTIVILGNEVYSNLFRDKKEALTYLYPEWDSLVANSSVATWF